MKQSNFILLTILQPYERLNSRLIDAWEEATEKDTQRAVKKYPVDNTSAI